jgi:hypothetical protein
MAYLTGRRCLVGDSDARDDKENAHSSQIGMALQQVGDIDDMYIWRILQGGVCIYIPLVEVTHALWSFIPLSY